MQCDAVCCRAFPGVLIVCAGFAVCCSVLQRNTVRCSVIQCVALCFRIFLGISIVCAGIAVSCSAVQCVAECCSVS